MTTSSNGDKKAIEILEENQDKIQKQIRCLEQDGCAIGREHSGKIMEIRDEMRTMKRLLWAIILILVGIGGPQLVEIFLRIPK